jgi:CBS domain containing-hemolysin-like protein
VTPWLIVLALVVLNGFFVSAEFALVAAPRAAIEHRAARGQWLARIVRAVVRSPSRPRNSASRPPASHWGCTVSTPSLRP